MSNAEGMTKHECSDESDDSFWFEERTLFIREEPGTTPVYDFEDKRNRNAESGITAQEPGVSRHWSFVIRHSSLQP